MTPKMLIDSGWVQKVKGIVVAPQLPTCAGRTIDFFVVSDTIGKCASSANAMTGWPHQPHVPVRITMRGDPRTQTELTMTVPKRFPKENDVPTNERRGRGAASSQKTRLDWPSERVAIL